jgi:hypothetical protein
MNIKLKSKTMNLLKKGMFVLLGLGMTIACSDDDDTNIGDGGGGGNSAEITNVNFTSTAGGDGSEITVTPTSSGGTSYSIDFNDPAAADGDDIKASLGTGIMYDYPNEDASYTVTVTATATGKESVSYSADVTVTYVEGEASLLIGEWVMWPNPGAMMIASSLDPETNGNWWANNLQDVGMRSCFFDDKYVFSADKSFTNDVGDTTWTEFDGTQCVDAFAPYDGSIEANWIHDVEKGTVTLNGQGSYLGIKKVANGVELSDATGAPSSRTYDIVSLNENVLSLRIAVANAGGLDGENAYWYFILAKVGSEEAEIPQTDGDGDGVLDINDECPEEAGSGANGCVPEGEEPAAETPTDAPAAPTAAQADVLSIFSDAYTDLAGSDFDPNWGQETDATIETYAGNEVLQYKDLNYQGLQYAESDVSGYTKLHLDYWTADATVINVSLISVGPLENPVALTVTTGSWQSVDINLSEYTTPNLSEVFQLKTDGDGTVILDNIYFY